MSQDEIRTLVETRQLSEAIDALAANESVRSEVSLFRSRQQALELRERRGTISNADYEAGIVDLSADILETLDALGAGGSTSAASSSSRENSHDHDHDHVEDEEHTGPTATLCLPGGILCIDDVPLSVLGWILLGIMVALVAMSLLVRHPTVGDRVVKYAGGDVLSVAPVTVTAAVRTAVAEYEATTLAPSVDAAKGTAVAEYERAELPILIEAAEATAVAEFEVFQVPTRIEPAVAAAVGTAIAEQTSVGLIVTNATDGHLIQPDDGYVLTANSSYTVTLDHPVVLDGQHHRLAWDINPDDLMEITTVGVNTYRVDAGPTPQPGWVTVCLEDWPDRPRKCKPRAPIMFPPQDVVVVAGRSAETSDASLSPFGGEGDFGEGQ